MNPKNNKEYQEALSKEFISEEVLSLIEKLEKEYYENEDTNWRVNHGKTRDKSGHVQAKNS